MMDQNFSSAGLICHVEFPKLEDSLVKHFQPINKDVESKGEEKSPVIVLVGWAGAKDKHLAKYSDIYAKNGVSISEHSKLPGYSNRVANIMKDYGFQHHPIFFHVFSNGGTFFYSFLIKEIAKETRTARFDIRGTIFDSAPVPQSLQLGYRAAKSAFKSYQLCGLGNILATIVGAGTFIFLVLCTVVYYNLLAWEFCTKGAIFVGSPSTEKYLLITTDWLTRICKLENHAFLFLYSDTDAVCPSDKIEMVAGYLGERGNKVSMVKFEGSEHVLHYRLYPKEYVSEVSKFINQVLDSGDSHERPTKFWDECH